MQLTVFERLLLRNIVPQIQGWNYANMKDARELLEGLFTEQEETDLQFEQDGTQVKWKVAKEEPCDECNGTGILNGTSSPCHNCTDSKGIIFTPIPQERDIPVTEGLKKKIGKFLTQLDKEEKLGFEHMTLCGKFMDD